MGKYILIDIGGTAIKYALSEEDRILFRNIIKTESGRGRGQDAGCRFAPGYGGGRRFWRKFGRRF